MGHVQEPTPDLTAERSTLLAKAKKPAGAPNDASAGLPHDTPLELEAIYRRLMAKEPRDRYTSAEELASALLQIIIGKKPVQPAGASGEFANGPASADAALGQRPCSTSRFRSQVTCIQ